MSTGEFCLFQKRRQSDFEASKLWKGRSGGIDCCAEFQPNSSEIEYKNPSKNI